MKKIILTKTTEVVQKPADGNSTTLSDRKSMLPNYKELFKVLFELPDKKVVARVLDAINNRDNYLRPNIELIEVCSKCKQQTPKVTMINASTQTDGNFVKQHTSAGNSDDSRDTPPITSTAIKVLNAVVQQPPNESTLKDDEDDIEKPAKKRRRRKIQVPQVIKKSQAQEQQKRNKPILQKRKTTAPKSIKNNDDKKCNLLDEKRPRLDSVSSATSIFSDLYEDAALEACVTSDDIKLKMEDEWLTAESFNAEGLLPIHSAIIRNDDKQLGRQILIWQHVKKVDLNELLTEDDEDCLQLAVSEKSSSDIIKLLLLKGLNVDCRDAKSNTIIHLAILNEVSTDVLQTLMEKVDLQSLLVRNDDGYTPLHLSVRQDEYMLAEALLDALDKRLLGKSYYEREKLRTKKHFMEFYESYCKRSRLQMYLQVYNKDKLKQKRKLMDAGDIRSGNTALLFSVENKLEHLIYFLLAHFAHPRAEGLSGQSPTSFMNEFAKSLDLSLRIDHVMESIVILLN